MAVATREATRVEAIEVEIKTAAIDPAIRGVRTVPEIQAAAIHPETRKAAIDRRPKEGVVIERQTQEPAIRWEIRDRRTEKVRSGITKSCRHRLPASGLIR
jgi:hypothetical protein